MSSIPMRCYTPVYLNNNFRNSPGPPNWSYPICVKFTKLAIGNLAIGNSEVTSSEVANSEVTSSEVDTHFK